MVYDRLRAESHTRFVPESALATAAAAAGDLDTALDHLRRGVRQTEPQTLETILGPDLVRARLPTLEARPEFQELVKRLSAHSR